MNDFRERKQQERVTRIARRAIAAGGLQKLNSAAGRVNLDTYCAAPQPKWVASEPPVASPSER